MHGDGQDSQGDWIQLLTDPRLMTDLYDAPPELSRCDLFYVHLDERGDSVTLGFDTSYLPARPLPEWQATDFNTFEFHLRFNSVEELRFSGWSAPAPEPVLTSSGTDGGVNFAARGPGSLLEFTARQVEITCMRTYLASSAP
ncbi:Imm50 family immunity protein [Streptomyces sp. NPDC059897]|uniref:Imm50 family immunity protein n=1 Tax=Streptomyces sp. NPDC059897 TaxID=3346994 RepID=UPI003652B926